MKKNNKILVLILLVKLCFCNVTFGNMTFSTETSRLLLKDSNSRIKFNLSTVYGWQDRSITKKLTGKGLGDYNLVDYSGGDNIITYTEAPTELVYNNSNAILDFAPSATTDLATNNSNAIVSIDSRLTTAEVLIDDNSNSIVSIDGRLTTAEALIDDNSNSIVSIDGRLTTAEALIDDNSNSIVSIDGRLTTAEALIDDNSNSIVSIDGRLTTAEALIDDNSNSIVYLTNHLIPVEELAENNSNAIVDIDQRVINNSNTIKFQRDHFVSENDGKIYVFGQISGSTIVDGRGFLSSPINLGGGTLTLSSDLILSNKTTITSSGSFDLQGNAIIFGGNLIFPTGVDIKITSSGVLDGQGNNLEQEITAKLIVDNDVTLTLRNLNWFAAGSPQIEMRTATSKLALQNVTICFDRDFTFTQGEVYFSDEVLYTGTSKFSYVSTGTSYILPHSTLLFDKNSTFSYSPRQTSPHSLSERNLIKMSDKTSEIFFNECALQLPDSGWQLTKGTIYFDNKVTITGNTTEAQSFEWGNGTSSGELDVQILAGSFIVNYGYIHYNPGS